MAAHRFEDSFDVVGVTPQSCFDFLSDPTNGASWASFAQEVVPHGEPGPGQQVEARIGLLGASFSVMTRVTTWEEPHAYVLSGDAPFRGELGSRLAPIDGGTRVHSHMAMDPGRFFPVPGMVLRRALKLQFDRDTSALHRCLAALADDGRTDDRVRRAG